MGFLNPVGAHACHLALGLGALVLTLTSYIMTIDRFQMNVDVELVTFRRIFFFAMQHLQLEGVSRIPTAAAKIFRQQEMGTDYPVHPRSSRCVRRNEVFNGFKLKIGDTWNGMRLDTVLPVGARSLDHSPRAEIEVPGVCLTAYLLQQ
jgi:hypothetical protein